jgi:hypothetical protein
MDDCRLPGLIALLAVEFILSALGKRIWNGN